MDRSATRMAPAAVRTRRARVRPAALTFLFRVVVGAGIVTAAVLIAPGIVLDTPQPAPTHSDSVVVISGDEHMARFQGGRNRSQRARGQYLDFSRAAYVNRTRESDGMR